MEGQVKRSKFFVHIVYCEMHGQPCDLGPKELFICLFFLGERWFKYCIFTFSTYYFGPLGKHMMDMY